MVTALLLIIIYLSFISLGLPDTIIGVTIPALQKDFGIPLAAGGFLSMIVICGTVFSSFLSDNIIRKFGTGKVVLVSCLLTGFALLGFSQSPSFYWLLILAFPLGFGGGTVDVALNNYVAHHFKAHHMNWLHSCWGVGATLGPVIMSMRLNRSSWQAGFSSIAAIQLSFALLLLLSLSLWEKHKASEQTEQNDTVYVRKRIFSIKGIPLSLATMLLYCAAEIGVGLWGSSYLISEKSFTEDSAARLIALYYAGITTGRIASGVVSFKLNNSQLIRFGVLLASLGVILLFLPLHSSFAGAGIIITGLGLAPIFPAMIHETPVRFGKKLSQKIIGYQMGFAYIGSGFVPPLLGIIYQEAGLSFYPITLLLITSSLFLVTERLNVIIDKKNANLKLNIALDNEN
ncbi:Permeases of the major facilitator superfamily [Chitinispirillum alkaliphilum]|nr:Permeases of the major facilitator superfamily [Chitinispirillum alkaliphilum]